MKRRLIPIATLAILLVVLASVALVSAAPPAATRAAQSPSALEGVRWILVSYRDKAGDLADALPDAPTTAEFAAGKVGGSAGCNNYTASYTVDGEKLTIDQAASTMMMCEQEIMDQEMAFLTNLQAVAEYAVDAAQLTLFDDLGAPVLVFNAEQPRSIVGAWVMTSYNNGRGGFQSALADVQVTAVFDAEGKLTGNAGCNNYNASYTVDGDKIDIGPAITTRMSCAPDIMTQEAAYLKALEASAVFAIQGDELVLRDDKGAAQVGYLADKADEAAAGLDGTAWQMTAYNNGRGGVQTPLPDVAVTAIFAEGRVAGNAGCNNYSASFEEDGNNIKIGPPISTMMACEQKIMQQEAAYLKALPLSVTTTMESDELVLRDATGAVQVRYVATELPEAPAAAAPAATAPAPAASGEEPVNLAPRGVPGLYLTLRPMADGPVQLVALALGSDGKAEFRREAGEDKAPIVETGAWVENADGTVTVTLADRDGKPLATPQALKFQRDGSYLTLVDYDKAIWGEQGLKLNRAADVARKVRASLVTLDFTTGLALDPTFISVSAGGEIDAGLLSPDCKGYINRQPVATVKYGGGAPQVRTFFYSDGDPTLVILTPDGKLLCNDNASAQLLDPFVALDNPPAGEYRVWVGSNARNQLIPGILVFTANTSVDLGTFKVGELIKRPSIPQVVARPLTSAPADTAAQAAPQAAPMAKASKDSLAAAAPSLKPGAAPLTKELTAEGNLPLFRLPEAQERGCGGLVTGIPLYAFKWSGKTDNLRVSFAGDGDSTLMIIDMNNRSVFCNDDATEGDPNPAIDIENPADGTYLVYVGRINPEKPVKGTLTVAEAPKGGTQ
ncbi:MAG: META domain-containing protein [Anaerolineae bacterium]|nr:META domain-containing protein [Anaerolineae bacterium]